MLTQLKITNLALVDALNWQLGRGLVSVTGETGAGKSVIVGALKLVLGERADKSLIRTGENQCVVEAVFELGEPKVIDFLLEEAGLDCCEDGLLIVRRVFSASSNRQYINNSPVTLLTLASIGNDLVDLHGPHDHQSLLNTDRQMAMLDAFAGHSDLIKPYQDAYEAWKTRQRELDGLQSSERASEQEIDLLKFQIEEIDAAELKPEEEEQIEERYKRASSAGKLLDTAGKMVNLLENSDGGILQQVGELQHLSSDLIELDQTTEETVSEMESVVIELQEISRSLSIYVDDLQIDPQEAAELEKRVDLFQTLKRKYGVSLEEVLRHRDEAAKRLDEIENRGDRLERLTQEVKSLRRELDSYGKKLATSRKRKATQLTQEIIHHLKDLGFKQAQFEIHLTTLSEPAANGLQAIEFQFGPNPGEPLKALRQIASSGEMSRVMLAVKSALADQDATPLMVFDEIDANVGGEIAKAVGKKMANLGARHQVISITHFPQVAAVADFHYVVDKQVLKDRTVSKLRSVEGGDRVEELVRMLGGGGDEVKAMAESLLEEHQG